MLNIIQSVAEGKRTALTQKPLGEFAVLGLLLVGINYAMATVGRDANPSLPASTATVAQIDTLVDLINLAPAVSSNKVAAVEGVLAFTQTPATSVGRFDFSHITKPSNNAHANVNNSTSNKQYQFKPILTTTLGRSTDANLFDADALSSTALAIWDINNTFSLGQKKLDKITADKKRKPNDKFVIMIDPGHGGSDPGSIGHNGLEEKVLTLDIAKRAQLFLSEIDNIEVLLTRDGDNGMSRANRVRKVKQSNADMVVSLHLNHLPQTDVNLVESFYAAPHNILESIELQRAEESKNSMVKTTETHNHDLSFTRGSRQLATLMQKRVFDEVIHNNPDTDDAGVKEDTLYILTRSFTPGVLIEMSCLSNIQEAERLNDPAYRDKLAAALADGIRDYLSTPEAKRHFGPGV